MLAIAQASEQDTAQRNMRLLRLSEHKKRAHATALEDRLSEERLVWLGEYLQKRWDSLYSKLGDWRSRCQRNEEEAGNDFKWREKETGRDAIPRIFMLQNDTLNAVGSLAEFFAAQASNDLFGSTPWFSAKPEGRADANLAEMVPRHLHYKLKSSNLSEVYNDAVEVACVLGTSFVKKWWHLETDEWEQEKYVLMDRKTRAPVLTTQRDFVYDTDTLEEVKDEQTGAVVAFTIARDPELRITGDLDYQPRYFPQTAVTYRNVKSAVLHYKDIAFDDTATELCLGQTDFFHRFEITVAEARDRFQLTRLQVENLKSYSADAKKSEQRADSPNSAEADGEESGLSNLVTLIEGYTRMNVLGNGKMKNVYAVFHEPTKDVLSVDYLANVTPKGKLPIHRHRIYPKRWKLTGTSFYEKYAYAQDDIDSKFSADNYHIRKSANPIMGTDRSQLDEASEEEDADVDFNPDKPIKLRPDATIAKYLQFAKLPAPDGSRREQMQTSLQMLQLRTGISSASQGDIAGVPESNTATGVKALISRAAVLLKKQVDGLKRGFTEDLNYVAALIYANQNSDETFAWGDGDAQELLTLQADAVKGLDMNLTLLMSQSQNQFKLENADLAIKIFMQWLAVPEFEKISGRPVFLQALKALEFNEADTIIRQGVTQPLDILPLLSQELQPLFQQFLAGLGVQPGAVGQTPPQASAPATNAV